MFDAPHPIIILSMAEFVKQTLPVSAVLAGVTLAVAFVERARRDPVDVAVRDTVVRLLTVSSVSLICAICAAALFLAAFEMAVSSWSELAHGDLSDRERSRGLHHTLERNAWSLAALWVVNLCATIRGVSLVLKAIGESGLMVSEAEGRRTRRLKWAAYATILACFVLLFAL